MGLDRLLKYLFETESWERTSNRRKAEVTPSEAPEGAPCGQYLFAPIRTDVPIPKEPNTDLEKRLSKALSDHYGGTGNIAMVELGMLDLIELEKQGMYKKLLSPPSGLAYRYISNVKPQDASALFLNNYPIEEIISNRNKAFHVRPVGIVKRPSAVSTVNRGETALSSWTITPQVPNFSDFTYSRDGLVSILLVADIKSNDFFLNPDNIAQFVQKNKTLDVTLIKREREVVAFGPVNVIEASAVYIKAEFDGQAQETVLDNCPKLKLPQKFSSNEVLPTSCFRETYDYIQEYIDQYKDKLTKKQLENITTNNAHYFLLRLGAKFGLDLKLPSVVRISRSSFFTSVEYKTFDDPFEDNEMYNFGEHLKGGYGIILSRLFEEVNNSNPLTVSGNSQLTGRIIQKELLKALGLKIQKTTK